MSFALQNLIDDAACLLIVLAAQGERSVKKQLPCVSLA